MNFGTVTGALDSLTQLAVVWYKIQKR